MEIRHPYPSSLLALNPHSACGRTDEGAILGINIRTRLSAIGARENRQKPLLIPFPGELAGAFTRLA
jgi:hypothetical protein